MTESSDVSIEILWVEDVVLSICANVSELRRRKFRLDLAESFENACEMLTNKNYSLVFVDYSLPVSDGQLAPSQNSLGLKLIEKMRDGSFGETNANAICYLCTAQTESVGPHKRRLADMSADILSKANSYFEVLEIAEKIRGEHLHETA